MAFSLLCDEPDWTKKEVQWYMLSENTAKDKGRNVSKSVKAGCIFKIDYDESNLDSKEKFIILQSCNKGKVRVKWAPKLFYGLDEKTKDILLAVDDYPERLHLYEDRQELVLYAKELKVGDDVSVQFPKLRHYQVSGTVKYIGPIDSKCSARYFGVELRTKCGDTDGRAKNGKSYFKCEPGRGAFVPVNNLLLPSSADDKKKSVPKPKKNTEVTPSKKNQTDDLGVQNAPHPPFVELHDRVVVKTKMKKDSSKLSWVLGQVICVHKEYIGVEVDKNEGKVFMAWNGCHGGNRLYHTPTPQTVLVSRKDVSNLHSPVNQSSNAANPQANCDYAGAVKGTNLKVSTNVSNTEEHSISTVSNYCMKELQRNTTEAKNLESDVLTSQPLPSGSALMDSDQSLSDSRISSSSRVEGLHSHSPSSIERSHSLTESYKTCEERSLQSLDGTKEKSSWKSYLPSFARANAPPYPFGGYEVEVLSKDLKNFKEIVSDLGLNQDWDSICRKEKDNYFRVEFMLKKWWRDIPEKHRDEKHRFLHLLAKHGLDDLRDYIIEVPDFGGLNGTVEFALVSSVGDTWKKFAIALGLLPKELNERINQQMQPYEALNIVLQMWQEKDQGSKKLTTVIRACRNVGLDDIANEIEQGLSEEVLKKIAHRIENKNLRKFCDHIGVSRVRCDAFDKKFPRLAERVYYMLCWWSMKLPLNVDKAELLTQALKESKQENIAAEELSRGIEVTDLEAAACLISDRWQTVAAVLVTSKDIDYLRRFENDVGKALHLLKIWKRRQPLTAKNLKEALYSHLMDLEMYRAARQLYDGLDNGTITRLSRKLCFDWPLLANQFGYSHDEVSRRLATSNHIDMSLIVLKEWLHANEAEDTEKTKAKLKNGLMAIGREDLVEWMQRRVEEDVEEKLEKATYEQQDRTSKFRKLDRIILEEVAEAINDLKPNSVMEILDLSSKELNNFLPKHVQLDKKKPHFAILCSWKRKMMHSGSGELDCIESLVHLLKTYEEDKAAAILTDGTSVDPVAFGSQGEAVGGASVPAHYDLNVNSMVEVTWGGKILPGVIQWIGVMKGLEEHGKIAGVELEDFAKVGATDGKFGNTRHFSCQYGRGLFVPLSRCRPDSRFLTETETYTSKEKMEKEDFGNIECDPVVGHVKPPETVKEEHIGIFKGIQGDHNSCYMDVTLYSMFAFSDLFDAILQYTDTAKTETKDVKDALRETIVNPLRSHGVVRADHVLRFRDLLSLLSSMEGFRTEEKDPEEFIHALLQELLNAKPFLKISQGTNATMESFVYQIFTDKKKYLDIPTVEDLLHVSFLESDLKLSEVPDCFIVQLPRYGKKYKLYDWIIPSLEMDISLLIRESPRPCNACGKLAFMECRDCTPEYEDDDIIQNFCGDCFPRVHSQKSKKHHHYNPLNIPKSFVEKYQRIAKEVEVDQIATETEHLYEKRLMELFSVVCIETSHYVAFVKTGSGEHAQWVFFDSMADRRGDQHGYNVPEVSHLRDFEAQMTREDLRNALKGREELPKYLKRLLSDAYICFYRPTKSGSGISPKGRTRSTGGREQNVAISQGAAFSAGTNHSQQNYENLSKNSGQHHGGGHYLKDDNIDKSREGMDVSKTDHSSQKKPRERRREHTQKGYSHPTTEYSTSSNTRLMGTNLSVPRSDVIMKARQSELEKQVHHFSHQHQSIEKPNTSYDEPMEIDNAASEVSNPVYDQVPEASDVSSDTGLRATTRDYPGNIINNFGQTRMEGHVGMEKQQDDHHQPETGARHAPDNSYVAPMETDDPSKQVINHGDHHRHSDQLQNVRQTSDHENKMREQSPRNMVTPKQIKEENISSPRLSSHAHESVNQHQRSEVHLQLRSERIASGEDVDDSLKEYVIVKPGDTSLQQTDADSLERANYEKFHSTRL